MRPVVLTFLTLAGSPADFNLAKQNALINNYANYVDVVASHVQLTLPGTGRRLLVARRLSSTFDAQLRAIMPDTAKANAAVDKVTTVTIAELNDVLFGTSVPSIDPNSKVKTSVYTGVFEAPSPPPPTPPPSPPPTLPPPPSPPPPAPPPPSPPPPPPPPVPPLYERCECDVMLGSAQFAQDNLCVKMEFGRRICRQIYQCPSDMYTCTDDPGQIDSGCNDIFSQRKCMKKKNKGKCLKKRIREKKCRNTCGGCGGGATVFVG